MAVTVRTLSSTVVFSAVTLTDVIGARGQVTADGGWPTCSVFVTAKPGSGATGDGLTVTAGAGNNVVRFTGVLRRFRTSSFPKAVELVAMGTLAYADEWSPDEDIPTILDFPAGATDEELVEWALDHVPGVSYSGGNIGGAGITIGETALEIATWRAGVTAWQYIQAIDRATLYRTYQKQNGDIFRVSMIGHPSGSVTTFTLDDDDLLEGSSGSRDTERTRNAVMVRGYDYGNGNGPVLGFAAGAFGDLDGTGPSEWRLEEFSSPLIEDGNDPLGSPLGLTGINAQDVADAILDDVLKEFVNAEIQSWRDDTHGPGQTCLLDCANRLAINEKMWVQGYAWEISESGGWQVRYTLSGGGIEPTYTPPGV